MSLLLTIEKELDTDYGIQTNYYKITEIGDRENANA